jgi:hypothetical protein
MTTKSETILVQDISFISGTVTKAKMIGHLRINNLTDVQASDTEATLATMY